MKKTLMSAVVIILVAIKTVWGILCSIVLLPVAFVSLMMVLLFGSDEKKVLIWAKFGKLKKVQSCDVSYRGTVLDAMIVAISAGHSDVAKYLLDLSVKRGYSIVNSVSKEGLTPLKAAILSENMEALNMLIESGARLSPDDDHPSPLVAAVSTGNEGVLGTLLAHGVDPNEKDHNGMTALHYACSAGSVEMAKNLIENGADPCLKTKNGLTPLIMGVIIGNLDLVNLLLEKGADPYERYSRQTVLSLIVHQEYKGAVIFRKAMEVEEKVRILNVLDKESSRPENAPGMTAVEAAAETGNAAVVQALRKASQESAALIKNPCKALIASAGAGSREGVMKILSETNINPNAVDEDGMSAIVAATLNDHSDIVKILLDFGADPNSRSREGDSVLKIAGIQRKVVIAKLLVQAGGEL